MTISTKALADMMLKYLNRQIALTALVDWAENMLRDADFEADHFEDIRDVLAHVGLADIREFGISWDDCYGYLRRLGYNVSVSISKNQEITPNFSADTRLPLNHPQPYSP